MKVFRRSFIGFFDIRRQEFGRVLLMSMYLLLIIAAYSTVKAVRDSLFVTKIGAAQLPYVYLLIAGAMGVVSLVYSRAVNLLGLHRLIRATSLVAVSNLLLFWFALRNDSPAWLYVFYVWVSLFGAMTASQCWLLATHLFNPREARRVFSWIGVGGILGGVLGGALTSLTAHWLGTESLLIVCAGMMATTLVLLKRIPVFEAGTGNPESQEFGLRSAHSDKTPDHAIFRRVRESRHLTMMVLLLGVALIVEAFIDYEYKLVANQAIASKDHLTAFFGSITFYVGILALLFQMLATNRILKRFGVGWAILVLPATLFGSFLAVAIRPALWTAALLQLADGVFSYSIHRSGMELLYLPIPPQTRNAVKGFIDTFVDRSGRAAGAVLLLLFTSGLALSITSLSLVACGLVIAWLAVAVVIRGEYMHSFRQALEKRTIEPESLQFRNVDAATLKTLLWLLSSPDDRHVLYALDLLSTTNPQRWRSHVDLLVRHRSAAVRGRIIAVLTSWNDPALARAPFIQHPDSETASIATASALRLHWRSLPQNRELLNRLLHDSKVAVVREAIITAGIVGFEESLPVLIEKLADKRLRRDARQALVNFGDQLIPELFPRLSDAATSLRIRKRIPKTLAFTGKQVAADALLSCLHRLDVHLDYEVLKALNRMRINWPQVVIDDNLVRAAIGEEREEYARLREVLVWLEDNPSDHATFRLLTRALQERLEHRLERILRLVGLTYSPNDVYSVYYNCKNKPALRPAAIEFLENILDAELKEALVPMLEEAFDPEKPRVQQRAEFICLDAALAHISADEPWLRTIAGELQRGLERECSETREGRVIAS